MMSPCKDCPDRHPTCHGSCNAYKEWKVRVDAAREAERLRNSIDFVNARPRGKWTQSM